MNGIQLMKSGLVTKEDITYTVQEFEGKQYQATVTIKCQDEDKSFAGETAASKKKAEESAASIAYGHMKDTFAPLQEEHRVRKKQKNAEALSKLKERIASEKAVKKADTAA